MSDQLKFINDIESRATTLAGNTARRSLDALDEFRSENIRLRRELLEAREQVRQLREQLEQRQVTRPIQAAVPVVAPIVVAPASPDNVKDDTEVRFSLLELT